MNLTPAPFKGSYVEKQRETEFLEKERNQANQAKSSNKDYDRTL